MELGKGIAIAAMWGVVAFLGQNGHPLVTGIMFAVAAIATVYTFKR